jgi:prophage DNA circulation protein
MQAPDTTVNLGPFQFALFEIPERISWGGSQRIAVHELVGGQRVLDAMGRSDRALVWSGLFMGQNATERARFLDTMRAQGLPQTLTFGQLAYSVLVARFEPDYERFYQIPYHLELEVIADLANPVTSVAPASIDSDILTDYDASNLLATEVADSTLTNLLTTLGVAIGAVASFSRASRSSISGVQQPLAAVQARVAVLLTNGEGVLGGVSTFGGVQPGVFGSVSAASISAQSANMTQFNALLQLGSLTSRMAANLGAISSSPNTVTTAGGNMFAIAQQQYGDATEWTTIAKANNLSDPFVQGTQTLVIPSQPDQADGVLNA